MICVGMDRKEIHVDEIPSRLDESTDPCAPAGRGASPEGERSGLPAASRSSVRKRVAAEVALPDEVIDELLAGARTEEEIVGPGRGARAADQAAGGAGDGGRADRASRLRAAPGAARRDRQHPQRLDGEDAGRPSTGRCGSRRRGIATGSFEPQIVRKRQRRFEGFDDKILALYSRGLSTRDIEAHLAEIYGVKVGRDLISRVTDAVHGRRPRVAAAAAGGRLPGGLPRRAGA